MKLVTLSVNDASHAGLLVGDDVLDLAHPSVFPTAGFDRSSAAALLADPRALDATRHVFDRIRNDGSFTDLMRHRGALKRLSAVRLLAPLPRPSMILACGRAYRAHSREMQGANARPSEHPHAFIKSSNSVIGPGEPIRIPAQFPDKVDYEGEFSIVIGRPCHNVSAREALAYIGGYTIINDISARDWNPPKGGTPDWEMIHMGKQLPTFCPLGPCVATADEIADPDNVRLVTKLNGQVMQDANTSDLVFPVAETIAYLSRWYAFVPGDVITTGTPSGVGFARNPPVFLKAGDVLSVSVDGIGELSNPVVGPAR